MSSRARASRAATAARRARPIQIVATVGSGNGRALETARRLRDGLRARGRESRLEVFSDVGGLRRWAAAESGFSLLICVGGDASQSAAAAAAMRRSVPLLPVPSGFGNLFARQLGHPGRVEQALDLVDRGEVVRVDVGIRNGEPFLCQESFGLLSEIQQRVEAAGRVPRARWRRWLAYYREAARHLLETTPTPLRVVVDGRLLARDAVLVIVANVETYGAWLPLTPGASPVDGLFDVFVAGAASKARTFARLLERQLRVPGTMRGTLRCRGRRVAVAARGAPREELEVMPRALPVLAPRGTRERLEGALVGRSRTRRDRAA